MKVTIIDKNKAAGNFIAYECVYFRCDGENYYMKRTNGSPEEKIDIKNKVMFLNHECLIK